MKLASKMRQYISTLPVFMKFCVAQIFFVECHLDVVLEVLQVVGSEFLFLMREIFNFLNFGKKREKNIEVSKNINFGNLKL